MRGEVRRASWDECLDVDLHLKMVRQPGGREYALILRNWERLNERDGIIANFTRVVVVTLRPEIEVDLVWMLADHQLWPDASVGQFVAGEPLSEQDALDLILKAMAGVDRRTDTP